MVFEQIEPGLFQVHYQTGEDLSGDHQQPLLDEVRAQRASPVNALVFVLSDEVKGIDPSVPNFWLGVTADRSYRFAAFAIVSSSLLVRIAADTFGVTNALRGATLKVRSFKTEGPALEWTRQRLAAASETKRLELAGHQQPQLAGLLRDHRGDRGEAGLAVEADRGRVRRVDPQRERLAVHVAGDLDARG